MAKSRNRPKNRAEDRLEPTAGGHVFVLILGCFFLSGLTGLVYELLWTRLIVTVIGSAPFAVGIVLTVLMSGLGLGGYLAGRAVHRPRDANQLLMVYGTLEIIVAACGMLMPLALLLFQPIAAFLYTHLFDHFLLYNYLLFLGCFLLMVIPALCMGATLPVLSRFSITNISHMGSRVGFLYGINTLGAAFGAMLCGFVLIDKFGIKGSMAMAAGCNALIGTACVLIGLHLTKKRIVPEKRKHSEKKREPADKKAFENDTFSRQALIVLAVSGFSTMAYEVVWTRLLGLVAGPTTYSFTIVLMTFIAGLAAGSFAFGWLADRFKTIGAPAMLIISQMTAAFAALMVSQLLGNSQIFFAKLIYQFQEAFARIQVLQSCFLFFFMITPTFFLGAAFPLASRIYAAAAKQTGRAVGTAYAISSAGAVLGSFLAGFVLIPFLGKEDGIRLVVTTQLLVSLIAGVDLFRRSKRPLGQWAALPLLTLLGVILVAGYPSWDRQMLASGKYHRYRKFDEEPIGWFSALFHGMDRFRKYEKDKLVFFGDGIGGFTTVWRAGPDVLGRTDYTMINNGKADATTSRGDMCTQTLLAHVPMVFHPSPASVLVIGLGSGITAGEVLHYPIERLDIVEINEQVVEACRYFTPWNNHVLENPKTEMILQDGRAHLLLSNRIYDVIISEPSNPWMGGMAALFTAEFMQLAKNRLAHDGIYVQWFHSYQMDWPLFSLVGRTFATVFPNSILMSTNPGRLGPDFLFIGFKGSKHIDEAVATRNHAYSKRSPHLNLNDHRLLRSLIINENLAALFGEGPLNTDDRPRLEVAAPKMMHLSENAGQIENKLISRIRLSESTRQTLKSFWAEKKSQIDYAAFVLSFHGYDPNLFDFHGLPPELREQFARILEKHCSEAIISDFGMFGDDQLKKRCLAASLNKALANVNVARSKADNFYYIGVLYQELGFSKKALAHLFEALRIEPDDEDMNRTLKQALSAFPPEDALRNLRVQLSQNPMNPAFHFQLGAAYHAAGNVVQAVKNYQQALSIQSDFLPALKSLALLHMKTGKYSSAEMLFKKIIVLQPGRYEASYNMACMHALQNHLPEAIFWMEDAFKRGFENWPYLSADPDLSAVRDTRQFKRLLAKYSAPSRG